MHYEYVTLCYVFEIVSLKYVVEVKSSSNTNIFFILTILLLFLLFVCDINQTYIILFLTSINRIINIPFFRDFINTKQVIDVKGNLRICYRSVFQGRQKHFRGYMEIFVEMCFS